jgi:hypothetical protein
MSCDSPVFEYEEVLGMYDEICELLKDRADLFKLFTDLIKKGDTNYETESTASSEEYSDSEVVSEKIMLKKDEQGFLSID